MHGMGYTDFFLRLSDTMHSTSSSRQLVQGAPCSVTLHRTLRALQHWHAFEALLLTGRPVPFPSIPAAEALRFVGDDASFGGVVCICSGVSDMMDDESDMMVKMVDGIRKRQHE